MAGNTPDFTSTLPFLLSARTRAQSLPGEPVGALDIIIAGLPFRLAAGPQTPYRRYTEEAQRQQIDTSREPGEQTLSQWWTRTQDSWHCGAGAVWYDPGSDENTRFRFRDSVGIDPWTKGQLSLLRSMDQVDDSTGPVHVTGAVVDGVDVLVANQDGTVVRYTGDDLTPTTYTAEDTPVGRVVIAGSTVLVGSVEGIMSGPLDDDELTTQIEDSDTLPLIPWWVKERIIATRGPDLYEMALSASTLSAALYTHPDDDWTWTAVGESPTAILAAGNGATGGVVYTIALADSEGPGGTPTLGDVTPVAYLPTGEYVHALDVYMGQYVAIGTSKGVRIGVIEGNGSLTYGPLTVETASPVTGFASRDRFIYAAVTNAIAGASGAVRIDLGQQVEQDLRFAWATDVQTHESGTADSITFFGAADQVAIGVDNKGLYLQSADEYESEGTIYAGRVRFATTLPKSFVGVIVRASVGAGSAKVFTIRPDSSAPLFEFQGGDGFDWGRPVSLSTKYSGLPWLEMAFTLTSDGAANPVLDSWTLRALPRVDPQRVYEIPLALEDFEFDRNGTRWGWVHGAYERLRALEEIEEAGALVNVTDNTNRESFDAVIRRVEFVRERPSSRSEDGFGGKVLVTAVRV